MKVFMYCLIIALFLSSSTEARTYYVSEKGSNSNSGGKDDPWKEINYAMETVSVADSIIVSRGTYRESRKCNDARYNLGIRIMKGVYLIGEAPGEVFAVMNDSSSVQRISLIAPEMDIDLTYTEIRNIVFTENGLNPTDSGRYAYAAINTNTGSNYQAKGRLKFYNCIFILPRNRNKCIFYLNSSSVTLETENCVFDLYSGINDLSYINYGNAIALNSIFYRLHQLSGQERFTVTYSCFDDPAAFMTGTGNINADPEFVSYTDYHLKSTSPCIDAGNPAQQYNDRDNSRNDMGAYGGNYNYYTGFKNNKSASYLPAKCFSASPNPFTDRLTISLPSSGAIYSLSGQLIMNLPKGKHSIDTSKWREGVYIVKSGMETKRVVKVK